MLHFKNKDQYTQFAQNLNKWVDKAIKEHQEEAKQPKEMIKDALIAEVAQLRQFYGSYLATEVFSKERARIGRINNILLYRYNYINGLNQNRLKTN